MIRTTCAAALLALGAAASGCLGGPSVPFRDAFVLYRSPMEPRADEVVTIGFVNRGHARYVEAGNVAPGMIRGTDILSDEDTADVLGTLAAQGYPEHWTAVGTLAAALAMAPRDDLLLVERDDAVHVFVRGPAGGGSGTRRHLERFTQSKLAVIDAAGRGSGLRVIQNPKGAELFEKQIEELTRRNDAARKRREEGGP